MAGSEARRLFRGIGVTVPADDCGGEEKSEKPHLKTRKERTEEEEAAEELRKSGITAIVFISCSGDSRDRKCVSIYLFI